MGVSPELFEAVMDLPGTTDVRGMRSRLLSLARWNTKLQKGTLPKPGGLSRPEEAVRWKFIGTLRKGGKARFTQKHPKLLGSLMKQFMQLAKEFEIEAMQNQSLSEEERKPNKSDRPPKSSGSDDMPPDTESEEGGGPTQGDEGMEGEDGEGEHDDIDVDMEEVDSAAGADEEEEEEQKDNSGDGDFAVGI